MKVKKISAGFYICGIKVKTVYHGKVDYVNLDVRVTKNESEYESEFGTLWTADGSIDWCCYISPADWYFETKKAVVDSLRKLDNQSAFLAWVPSLGKYCLTGV